MSQQTCTPSEASQEADKDGISGHIGHIARRQRSLLHVLDGGRQLRGGCQKRRLACHPQHPRFLRTNINQVSQQVVLFECGSIFANRPSHMTCMHTTPCANFGKFRRSQPANLPAWDAAHKWTCSHRELQKMTVLNLQTFTSPLMSNLGH